MPLARRIAKDDDFDPAILMEILDELDGRAPFTDAQIRPGLKSSKFDWTPTDFVPAANQPRLTAGALQLSHMALSNDPMYVRALDIPYTRMTPYHGWPNVSGGGFPFPIRDGFCTPARTGDVVYEFRSSRSSGGDAHYDLSVAHSFPAGSTPVHGVCADEATAYVLCQGSTDAPYPSIKIIRLGRGGGIASDWLSLGETYTGALKIATNRQGTYLYVIAKQSGDTNYRRLLRIDVSAQTISECNLSDDNNIWDASVIYDDGAAADSTGTVYIARSKVIAAAGRVEYVKESSTDAYGGTFGATVDGNFGALAGEVFGGCIVRGAYAVFYNDPDKLVAKILARYKTPQDTGGSLSTWNTWTDVSSNYPAANTNYSGSFYSGLYVAHGNFGSEMFVGFLPLVKPFADTDIQYLYDNGNESASAMSQTYCGGVSSGRGVVTMSKTNADDGAIWFHQ